MSDTTAIIELLTSRICHDLVSPVGAVSNGVEFLEEMGADAGDDAIDLISHSAGQASAKLMAFRLAYGAGGRDTSIKPEDVHKAFSNLLGNDDKFNLDWDPYADMGFEDRPQGFCKILMGTLMIAMECLPKGGSIKVENIGAGKNKITAKGDNVAARDKTKEALEMSLSPDDLDPRLVHPYTMAVLAESYGFVINLGDDDASVYFELSKN